jgi:hypothetical protein
MKQHIQKYLSLLEKEIKDKIKIDFNLENNLFAHFQIFDFVNFFLIREYILNDNVDKKDLFIGIPEKEYRENFFASILNSLTIIKLFQNYFNYEKLTPTLDVGDLIYYNSRVRRLISKNSETFTFKYHFPRTNEKDTTLPKDIKFLQKNAFTKLNPNLVENKNTVKKIDEYKNFLNLYFDDMFPLLTDFHNKTLVIAEKSFFTDNGFLPIKYTAKSGKISNNLPFFNFMIECCNDYRTAKKYLTSNSESFDEIVVIGEAKYREAFLDILQELKWQGRIKNIVLIGTEKPNTQNEFTEWLWSKDEIKLANGEMPQYTQKKVIENSNLLNKLVELKTEIDALKNEKNVDISFVLKYTNFYFRNIITNTALSKGTYKEYCDRLQSYFKSEKFEEELNDQFYNRDVFNPETIKESTNKVFQKFQEISKIIETQNLKWNYIKHKSNELANKKLFLIMDKKNYSAIANQIKSNKISNLKLISDKRIDNQIDYLQSWINDDTKNIANRQYIIPYLNNVDLFDTLNQLKGNCEVLCYKDIDEISFDNLVQYFYTQEKSKLIHKDRNSFVTSVFSEDIQYLQRQLDDLFKFDLDNESFRNNSYESIDLPKDTIKYEIVFEDGTKDKFDSSKGVFLIDGSEQIESTIGEVHKGATIRFYQNNNRSEFRKILQIFDTENLLSSFDEYSDNWKQTLKTLLADYRDYEELHSKIFNNNYSININTFRLYFDDDSNTRFPRKKTLDTIRNFCIEKGKNQEFIVTEFDKFLIYSKKDHSIRQQAGKILGNDLIEYEVSGKTEKSDSLKKLPEDILQNLLQTVKTKTIKNKILLDDD